MTVNRNLFMVNRVSCRKDSHYTSVLSLCANIEILSNNLPTPQAGGQEKSFVEQMNYFPMKGFTDKDGVLVIIFANDLIYM